MVLTSQLMQLTINRDYDFQSRLIMDFCIISFACV